MRLDFLGVNRLLSDKLKDGKPFSCLRIDNTAGYAIDCLYKKQLPLINFYNPTSLVEGGIYPTTVEYGLNVVMQETLKIMEDADILGFVDISNEIRNGPLSQHFDDKPRFFNPEFYVMDPGALLGHATEKVGLPKPDVPWTHFLKGKKVLVVSTHAESIKHQWKNIDKVWGDNKELMAPYELVDVIRAPYHPTMDDRQPPNCNTWMDSVNYTKTVIDTYDYDVLLAGCTTSAPFFVKHAKDTGKAGIQTGGVIQLHFGVLGYRWTEVPLHSGWHSMYNEHWIRPLKIDEANKRNEFVHLETNFAYW